MTATDEPSSPQLTLIAAMDEGGVIGSDGGMPWHVPGDLRWFKQHTLDKPIVMGRRTFASIGRALPRRRNLVLSRDPDFAAKGCERVASLADAIEIARAAGAPELMVIGGAQVYALALPQASCLRITRIAGRHRGDTWFPEVDWSAWQRVDEQNVDATDDTPAHRFMTWRRAPA